MVSRNWNMTCDGRGRSAFMLTKRTCWDPERPYPKVNIVMQRDENLGLSFVFIRSGPKKLPTEDPNGPKLKKGVSVLFAITMRCMSACVCWCRSVVGSRNGKFCRSLVWRFWLERTIWYDFCFWKRSLSRSLFPCSLSLSLCVCVCVCVCVHISLKCKAKKLMFFDAHGLDAQQQFEEKKSSTFAKFKWAYTHLFLKLFCMKNLVFNSPKQNQPLDDSTACCGAPKSFASSTCAYESFSPMSVHVPFAVVQLRHVNIMSLCRLRQVLSLSR